MVVFTNPAVLPLPPLSDTRFIMCPLGACKLKISSLSHAAPDCEAVNATDTPVIVAPVGIPATDIGETPEVPDPKVWGTEVENVTDPAIFPPTSFNCVAGPAVQVIAEDGVTDTDDGVFNELTVVVTTLVHVPSEKA